MQPTSTPHRSARTQAAVILCDWLKTDQFPDRALAASHPQHGMLTELVYGCVRNRLALDWIIGQCTDRFPKPMAQALLYVGLYQLFFLDHVDDYAAVNETGESAKQLNQHKLVGLINAVLRRVQREEDALRTKLSEQPMSVRTSHPEPLVQRWVDHYGEARTQALCDWNNQRPATTIRVVHANQTPQGLRDEWAQAGINVQPHPARPEDCLVLSQGIHIPDLPGFDEGRFIVQDPSTLAAVDLLDAKPGETIFDLCASPGGKTAAMADRMRSNAGTLDGILVASDMHADRMPRLKENLDRLGLAGVRVEEADARHPAALQSLAQRCAPDGIDGILLDVPCSNTGVIQRRPDARYRLTRKRMQQLARTQSQLLTAAAPILRPGGRLVYSTCSLEPEENQQRMDDWLADHPDFQKSTEVSLFPPEAKSDGAYACRLRRSD